jgi:AcrR family transcriptional regulator
MARKIAKRLSARERLLAASDELFYRDGIHSTGIDAVIKKAGVAKGSLYYIFGGKDELVAAYLRSRQQAWRQRVETLQAGIDDPEEKILVIFDAIADYVSLPESRGSPCDNAAAEAPVGESQQQAIKEYRDWLRQSFLELTADAGVADSEALADALIVLYNGAMATARKGEHRAPRGDDSQTHRAAHLGSRESNQLGVIRLPSSGASAHTTDHRVLSRPSTPAN